MSRFRTGVRAAFVAFRFKFRQGSAGSVRLTVPAVIAAFILAVGPVSAATSVERMEDAREAFWDRLPDAEYSLELRPVPYVVRSYEDRSEYGRRVGEPLQLKLKRYPRPGAQPLLLIAGIASNDRVWDSAIEELSFARTMHAMGFDVWLGNLRHSGTPGFRSETPDGPHHWTVEDYAVFDLPALVDEVRKRTSQHPFLIGHSLAAWIFEGYLAGMQYGPEGEIVADRRLAAFRSLGVKGVVTVAGVYNVWWPHSLDQAITSPILSVRDYYKSNYELEALTKVPLMRELVYRLHSLPLGWVGDLIDLRLSRIPFIGEDIQKLYSGAIGAVIDTPVFNMFYYRPNTDRETVRSHVIDGLEELGPRLVEQLGNAVVHRETMSYYHGKEIPARTYRYRSIRSRLSLPILFVAGDRDRLAGAEMIYQDGYLDTKSPDKDFLLTEAGHLDVICGRRSFAEVVLPVAEWLYARY